MIVVWFFVAATPFVLAGLCAVGLGFTAKWADEREEAVLADDLECKYAASPCESRSYVRSGRS